MIRIMCFTILVALPFSASTALELQQKAEKNKVVLVEEGASVLTTKFSASFQDCTVEEAYSFIEKALDEKINIVVHPSAKDIAIPDFSVKRASAIMISNLLCNLVLDLDIKMSCGGEFETVPELIRQFGSEEEIAAESLDRGDLTTPVILVNMATRDEDYNPIEREFRIYQMELLLNDMALTMDDVATAIETAWQMIPESYSANLKYHAETHLLICTGTEKHLEILDRVIMELSGEGGQVSLSMHLQQLQKENQQLSHDNERLKYQYEAMKNKVEPLTREIKDLKAQLQALKKGEWEAKK